MDFQIVQSLSSGAIFGAALTAAGVYAPAVIVGQMQFTDFHMLKVFMTASATSAAAIYLSNRLQISDTKPRLPSSINLKYDRNIIGGALLGCGMTLTGACPGTVLPQVVTGVPTGPLVFSGGLLGGILYSRYRRSLQSPICNIEALKKPTVHEKVGLSKGITVLLYEGMCMAMVAGASYFMPASGKTLVSPVVGGLFVGGAQIMSLLLTKNTLGVSTAYEQVGDLFWWCLSFPSGKTDEKNPRPSLNATTFTAGTLLGSYAVSRLVQIPAPARLSNISAFQAVVGGVMLVFGARVAGGCTSGHGISGMSQLSVASIVSVVAMFGGGMGLAAVLRLVGV